MLAGDDNQVSANRLRRDGILMEQAWQIELRVFNQIAAEIPNNLMGTSKPGSEFACQSTGANDENFFHSGLFKPVPDADRFNANASGYHVRLQIGLEVTHQCSRVHQTFCRRLYRQLNMLPGDGVLLRKGFDQ